VFDNPCAYASVGFHLVVPADGSVVFEGTFDDTNWVPITFRQIGADGYRNHAHEDEDFIGSISTLRAFRVRTYEDGSTDGSLHGRALHAISTIEGIEHGNPPHNIGHDIIRFGVNVLSVVTDQVLYTPTTEDGHFKRFVITGYQFSLSGSGDAIIFDETNATENWIFAANVKIQITEGDYISHQFDPPFMSAGSGNEVKITTTGTAIVRGVMNGYEIAV
jgi:hypothetical protein